MKKKPTTKMELTEINNFKKPLTDGQMIELSNDNDTVQLFYRKSLDGSMQFYIELNCKIIAMNKRFRTFRDKVFNLSNKRELKLSEIC